MGRSRQEHDGHSPGEAPARRIDRRRGLPSGRAALGGALVAVAALGTYSTLRAADEGPTTGYVVVTHDLGPGRALTAADLSVVRGEMPPSLDGRTFRRVEPVLGAVTLSPMAEGEIVQAGGLAPPGSGLPTFSVTLSASDADGGDLQPGEPVQVFATYGSDVEATTRLLSARARIVAVGDAVDDLGGGAGIEVRLAVEDPGERSAILNATVSGRLAVVRTTGVEDPSAVPTFRPRALGSSTPTTTEDGG